MAAKLPSPRPVRKEIPAGAVVKATVPSACPSTGNQHCGSAVPDTLPIEK
jgi:hypothetical protein